MESIQPPHTSTARCGDAGTAEEGRHGDDWKSECSLVTRSRRVEFDGTCPYALRLAADRLFAPDAYTSRRAAGLPFFVWLTERDMGARESRHDPGAEAEATVADYYALLEVEETATADEIKAGGK